jgi:hypothetical protein
MPRPAPTEYAPYYATYVDLVPEDDVTSALRSQLDDTLALLRPAPDAVGDEVHPPHTWTVKQVVNHVIDTERIFAYRALWFARGAAAPLPGFDQNEFANAVALERVRLSDLVAEFEAVRGASLWLFKNLPAETWARSGEANKVPVSVRALAYIIAGHARHHVGILRRRLAGGRG